MPPQVTLADQQIGQLGQGAHLFAAVAQVASQGQRLFQGDAGVRQPPHTPQLAQDVGAAGQDRPPGEPGSPPDPGCRAPAVASAELPGSRCRSPGGPGCGPGPPGRPGRGPGPMPAPGLRRPAGRHLGLVVGQVPQGLQLGDRVTFAAGRGPAPPNRPPGCVPGRRDSTTLPATGGAAGCESRAARLPGALRRSLHPFGTRRTASS